MTGELTISRTAIPGLLVCDLPLHGDARGWFKENWQRAKMTALGLPDFGPVQNNMSFNDAVGVTRGLHAEPWDKLVSLAAGRIFGVWVDLRPGASFGRLVSLELGPDKAVFVPRGVANGYQSLAPDTAYSYLVNDHWSPAARDSYTYLNLADETVSVPWPIPLERAEISAADRQHPRLADVVPMAPKKTVVIGAGGQLGRALLDQLPHAVGLDLPDFDLTDPAALAGYPWSGVEVILNAAAYTAVDVAETPQGRKDCWAVNVAALARLVDVARSHRITLAHVSTDYVFDGTEQAHTEDEPFSPLGVYGQTKAAGDALVASLARHYIVRTSWVIGDGRNFVRTMADLARRGVSPTVVDDQYGRLTFTTDLAAGIVHLVSSGSPYGTYNLSNSGPVQSWAQIAADVFESCGRDRADVSPITTAQYAAGKSMAPRPVHSTLVLDKLAATGFVPPPAAQRLAAYLA